MADSIQPHYIIKKMAESSGHCDCCGRDSRAVAGFVHNHGHAIASYRMHWTVDHFQDTGANLDLVLGQWGEGTTPADRFAVAMIHRQKADGTPALMVIDAQGRPSSDGTLADTALRREDVIGTPLAQQVFAITDAIYEQDDRFF